MFYVYIQLRNRILTHILKKIHKFKYLGIKFIFTGDLPEYLKKNIAINNKSQTVECINKQCNKDIDNIKYNERMLIMCDCEGCEFEIFNKNNINNLKNSDLIIEMHVKSYDKTDLENHLSINHDIQRIGYGTSKMIDISNLDNYILDINNFSKVSRENRDKFHYFLIALAKNKNIIK